MLGQAGKHFGTTPTFCPERGEIVRSPLRDEYGYWMGAPSVIYDPNASRYYMAYRVRVSRERGRGIACELAESEDGRQFRTIGKVTQTQLMTPSIEKSTLFQVKRDLFRLYTSYVDARTSQWRIDLLEAQHPSEFDPTTRLPLLLSEKLGVEGIKDPVVFSIGGTTYLFAQCLPNRENVSPEVLHNTQDGFAVGLTRVESRLFQSHDGVRFEETGIALSPPSDGWDSLSRRVTTVVPVDPGFLVFYDGKASPEESYEERAGCAWTLDFRQFDILTVSEPIYASPFASGALRYVEAVKVGRAIYYYYEMAEASRAHSLRMSIVEQ